MKFDDILNLNGIDPAKCRYLRHAASELASAGWESNPASLFRDHRQDIEDYQSVLKHGMLVDKEYVISLAAFGGGRALFLGVYKVIEGELPFLDHPRYQELHNTFGWDCYTKGIPGKQASYSKMEHSSVLADMSGRMVISWTSVQNFSQHASDKREVLEIMEDGSIGAFQGYDIVLLNRADLEVLISNSTANKAWYTALSKVGGIYLITTEEGQQYVGAASGQGGIWQRWSNYAANPHGGNKLLKELLAESPDSYKKFTYSILEVVSGDKKLVLAAESRWKRKLGSRAFGLNDN